MPRSAPHRATNIGERRARALEGREILIETIGCSGSVRVSAVDAATGLEGAVVGPATASISDLERLAMGKLAMQIERAGDGGAKARAATAKSRGICV